MTTQPLTTPASTASAQERRARLERPLMTPGVIPHADGTCDIRVWAPHAQRLDLVITGAPPRPLNRGERGWWGLQVHDVVIGDRYRFSVDGGEPRPDPASRSQPEGVHAASAVVALNDFAWTDRAWRGLPLADYVLYELHLGTFSDAGTCDAAIAHLDELVDLGVTAVEIMPVAQCPGGRNWGYDGVYPFAVQDSLGGPAAFQRLIDACHARGLAVVLDVVYNHFGPEGNYLGTFMPIVSDRYRTPWGGAVNLDGPDSDGVRDFLIANARQWLVDFHVDALRLDAVHAMVDAGARHFLAELAAQVAAWAQETGRALHLMAESDLNASRLVRAPAVGGYGLDAQWTDDFHHALHALLTGEKHAYYADYGEVAHLRDAYAAGHVYAGRWSAGRRLTHGDDASDLPTERFVVFSQNHDQIGNRQHGDRLAALTDFEGLKCAAAAVLLSPYLPLLFMGEEWGERTPFQYFVDHSDPALIAAVRAGRQREFGALHGAGEMPDPFAATTWRASRLDRAAAQVEPGRTLRAFYRECLRLRRDLPALQPGLRASVAVDQPHPATIAVARHAPGCRTWLLLNPTAETVTGLAIPPGRWQIALDSSAGRWLGRDGVGEHPPTPGDGLTRLGRSALLLIDLETVP